MPTGPATVSARSIARKQLRSAILGAARAQLALVGPAQLSVRAVAREVGMVSSAVYRYFPSRDDLLTELIIICYDEVGAQTEAAERRVPRAQHQDRWLAIARAFRGWAVAHPHDFALLYGSPVPGYAAPPATVEPAGRVAKLILAVVVAGEAQSSGAAPEDPTLHVAIAGLREFAGGALADAALVAGVEAFTSLVGALTFELFGHLVGAVEDHAVYFDAAMRRASPLGVA